MKQNWKTTGAGIAAILVAIGAALKAFTDNDSSTVPDIGACVAAIIAGVGLILAKDAAKAD
jgi:hypothetical protein